MSEAEFKTSLHEWYSTTWDKEAAAPIKQLSDCETIFNKGVERYLPLQTWGFDIPDTYNVVLTPFAIGGGGAGQRLAGHGPVITMWYGRQYTEGGRSPEEVLLHEAYHLGADETIKRKLGGVISDKSKYQRAKERVVDWCSAEVLVPQVLPIYHYQFGEHLGQPKDHSINAYLQQTNLPVSQRLQLYAKSFKN